MRKYVVVLPWYHKARRFRVIGEDAVMNTIEIDNLVRKILQNLRQPSTCTPEVSAFIQSIGADGRSMAILLRTILANWAEDATMSLDVRDYAQQQLAALPDF